MVHVPFDPRSVSYEEHVLFTQLGGGLEDVVDDDNMYQQHYFRGMMPYQRGYGSGIGRRHASTVQMGAGFGDILRGLWRILLPVARRAGMAAGRELVSTSDRILNRVKEGESLKKATLSEGKKGVRTLLEKGGLGIPSTVADQAGAGFGRSAAALVHRTPRSIVVGGEGGSGKGVRKKRSVRRKHKIMPEGSHQLVVGREVYKKPPPVAHAGSFIEKRKKRQRSDTFGLY